jgi:hypothetical protein
MRHVLAAVLCIAIPVAMFGSDNGYKITYDGGSLPDAKAGTGMKIYIEAGQVRLAKDNADVVKIPCLRDHRDQLRTGRSPANRDGGCGWRLHPGRGRIDRPQQIQETLHRIDLGRRRQKRRSRLAVR